MGDMDAFLAKMYENPDDDAPALAFADWLRENDKHLGPALLALLRGGPGRKAWLCSSGWSYSDYGIDAVFLSRAEADEFDRLRKQVRYHDANDNAEFVVGRPEDSQVLRDQYTVVIDLMTGEIEDEEPQKVMTAADAGRANRSPSSVQEWVSVRGGGTAVRERICSYRSQEHAHKLAVEWRQEFLRLIGGTDRLMSRGGGMVGRRQ